MLLLGDRTLSGHFRKRKVWLILEAQKRVFSPEGVFGSLAS
jgi:hypothetical protein